MMDGWELNPDGSAKVRPIMGYATATVPQGGLLRLEYAETIEDIPAQKTTALQLQMNAAQARDLAFALIRVADRIEYGGT